MDRVAPITVAVEGSTDEFVIRRLLSHVGLQHYQVIGKNGKHDILAKLPQYNRAAQHWPWLVCVDLDHDAECALQFISEYLPDPSPNMYFRVAVRAIESWLLADRNGIAGYLGIAAANVPLGPDDLSNPKEVLINLARRSTRKALRDDIVPRVGSGARVGPGYISRIAEFVTGAANRWRPEVAAATSPSLNKCINILNALG